MDHFDEVRALFRITGRVQGVGFRWFVLREAEQLGLRGWVRNTRDGSVEVEVQGTGSQIVTLRERLEKGPPSARVAQVTEMPAGNAPLPEEFGIIG